VGLIDFPGKSPQKQFSLYPLLELLENALLLTQLEGRIGHMKEVLPATPAKVPPSRSKKQKKKGNPVGSNEKEGNDFFARVRERVKLPVS